MVATRQTSVRRDFYWAPPTKGQSGPVHVSRSYPSVYFPILPLVSLLLCIFFPYPLFLFPFLSSFFLFSPPHSPSASQNQLLRPVLRLGRVSETARRVSRRRCRRPASLLSRPFEKVEKKKMPYHVLTQTNGSWTPCFRVSDMTSKGGSMIGK